MVFPESWPHSHQDTPAPPIIVILMKALYGLKHAPQLWHKDINTVFLLLGFTHLQADPNLNIGTDGILIVLYFDDISLMYARMESASKAAIEVHRKLLEKYKIMNLSPARQFLGIGIPRNDHGISLRLNALITTVLKRFHMQDAHTVATPMDRNVKLHISDDRGVEGTQQGQAQALSSDCQIVDVCSAYNAARYIICGRCPLPIQFSSIHQPYDCCKESAPLSRSHSLLFTVLQQQWQPQRLFSLIYTI